MSWRPRKRVYKLPNDRRKTVWIARYGLDAAGKELLAKPDWNHGSATFELRKDAQRAIDEELAKPATERERVYTVGGYLPHWLTTRPRSERTDHTNQHRITRVLKLKIEGRALSDWDLRRLRRRHAYELVARMLGDQGRSAGGCRAILRALSAMTEDAITDELCEINPWKGAKVRDDDPRAHKAPRELRIWSFEEMHEFASFAGSCEPMIRVLSDCGLRLGECLALERTDHRPGSSK